MVAFSLKKEKAVLGVYLCLTLFIMFLIAVSVKTNFSRDSSPILPRDIQCSGDEVTLSNCSITEYDQMECEQVAGVICEGMYVVLKLSLQVKTLTLC